MIQEKDDAIAALIKNIEDLKLKLEDETKRKDGIIQNLKAKLASKHAAEKRAEDRNVNVFTYSAPTSLFCSSQLELGARSNLPSSQRLPMPPTRGSRGNTKMRQWQ